MNKKYTITSVSSLVPLVVRLKDSNNEFINIEVKVDYQNDQVYFDNLPHELEGVDLDDLKQKILDYFKPPDIEIPEDLYEYINKAQEITQPNYASSFVKNYQNNESFSGDK